MEISPYKDTLDTKFTNRVIQPFANGLSFFTIHRSTIHRTLDTFLWGPMANNIVLQIYLGNSMKIWLSLSGTFISPSTGLKNSFFSLSANGVSYYYLSFYWLKTFFFLALRPLRNRCFAQNAVVEPDVARYQSILFEIEAF